MYILTYLQRCEVKNMYVGIYVLTRMIETSDSPTSLTEGVTFAPLSGSPRRTLELVTTQILLGLLSIIAL